MVTRRQYIIKAIIETHGPAGRRVTGKETSRIHNARCERRFELTLPRGGAQASGPGRPGIAGEDEQVPQREAPSKRRQGRWKRRQASQ